MFLIVAALLGASGSFDLCPSPDFSLIGDAPAQVVKQAVAPQVLVQQAAVAPPVPVYYYSSPVVINRANGRLFRSSAFGACTTGNCR
jgi:hypothetical protein